MTPEGKQMATGAGKARRVLDPRIVHLVCPFVAYMMLDAVYPDFLSLTIRWCRVSSASAKVICCMALASLAASFLLLVVELVRKCLRRSAEEAARPSSASFVLILVAMAFASLWVRSLGAFEMALTFLALELLAIAIAWCISRSEKARTAASNVVCGLMVVAVDLSVLLNSTELLWHAIEGSEEFWGEGRELNADACEKPPDEAAVKRCATESGPVKRGSVRLGVTRFPHRCIGAVNAGPGELFARLVDPETGEVLAEGKGKWLTDEGEWSDDPEEAFPFSLPCHMFRGCRNRLYLVRCEVWLRSAGSGEERKLDEALLPVSGRF